MKLDRGFYTALGTPLDADGRVLARSLCDEIERMTAAGTSGLLLLGSMGMQPAVAPDECAAAAKIAACQNAGRTPLFVGVMDNSIRAVCARIDALRGLPVDGVVLTPPYYYGVAPEALRNFYHSVADFSPFPVFLYDLPVTRDLVLTYPMVAQLQKHPNIRGIKTADLPMILELQTDAAVKRTSPLFTAVWTRCMWACKTACAAIWTECFPARHAPRRQWKAGLRAESRKRALQSFAAFYRCGTQWPPSASFRPIRRS